MILLDTLKKKTVSSTDIILSSVTFQQMKQRTKKIFVGGVPTDMPEETIRKYFEEFGPVSSVQSCKCTYM